MKKIIAVGFISAFSLASACNSKKNTFQGSAKEISLSTDQIAKSVDEANMGASEEDRQKFLSMPVSSVIEASLEIVGDDSYKIDGVTISNLSSFYSENHALFKHIDQQYGSMGEFMESFGTDMTSGTAANFDKDAFRFAAQQLNDLMNLEEYQEIRDILKNPDGMFEAISANSNDLGVEFALQEDMRGAKQTAENETPGKCKALAGWNNNNNGHIGGYAGKGIGATCAAALQARRDGNSHWYLDLGCATGVAYVATVFGTTTAEPFTCEP